MSTLENTVLVERFIEAFDEAIANDKLLIAALAERFLGDGEYHLTCERCLDFDLSDYATEIYETIEETFWDCDASCFDIRALAETAFDMEIV